MLEYLSHPPAEPREGSPVLVLLHGRGSHMGDLQGLVQMLPEEAYLITPQAPHAGGPWGYGPGWAWYRYEGDDRADPGSLKASLSALEEFLGALPGLLGAEPGPIILGGFSQGGTTSLAYALTHPGEVRAVVNLSGFLVAEESLEVDLNALGNTPLFWGHGTEDPAVPFSLAIQGRRRLEGVNANLEARDYRMGHWVAREEMEDLRSWVEEVLKDGSAEEGGS